MNRHFFIGGGAALLLVLLYLGILSLARSPGHALTQTRLLWYWVLPLLGLAGLSIFLVQYQVFFIVAGVLSNGVGITIMLESIQRHHPDSPLRQWHLNLSKLKRGALILAPIILIGVVFLTELT